MIIWSIHEKYHIRFLALFAILITACNGTTGEYPVDQSFLTGEPCPAPCWYGLEIGVSTEEELLETLKKLSFVDQESIHQVNNVFWPGEVAYAIEYNCSRQSGYLCGDVGLVDQTIIYISQFLQYRLTLREVIDILGPPEYMDYYWMDPHNPQILVSFLWSEKSILASANIKNINQIDDLIEGEALSADMLIESITYSVPDGFQREVNKLPWPGIKD